MKYNTFQMINRKIRKALKIVISSKLITCFLYFFCKKNNNKTITTFNGLDYINGIYIDKGSSCISQEKRNIFNKYDLTVIVPCYNAERYVEECIGSIVGQINKSSYKIELIIVNDGSTDNTMGIVNRFKELPYIKIITKENGGVSSARNIGLSFVEGKYVMFVDSDDYIINDIIEKSLSYILRHNFERLIYAFGHYELLNKKIVNKRLQKSAHGNYNKLFGFPWGKIYSSNLFDNIDYPLNYVFEDTVGPLILFSRADTIICTHKYGYVYRKNDLGLTNKVSGNYQVLDTIWVTNTLLRDRDLLFTTYDPFFKERLFKQIVVNYHRTSWCDNIVKLAIFNVAYEWSLKYESIPMNRHRYSHIEKAILERDYSKYVFYCSHTYL